MPFFTFDDENQSDYFKLANATLANNENVTTVELQKILADHYAAAHNGSTDGFARDLTENVNRALQPYGSPTVPTDSPTPAVDCLIQVHLGMRQWEAYANRMDPVTRDHYAMVLAQAPDGAPEAYEALIATLVHRGDVQDRSAADVLLHGIAKRHGYFTRTSFVDAFRAVGAKLLTQESHGGSPSSPTDADASRQHSLYNLNAILAEEWADKIGYHLVDRKVLRADQHPVTLSLLAQLVFQGDEAAARRYFTRASLACNLDEQDLVRKILEKAENTYGEAIRRSHADEYVESPSGSPDGTGAIPAETVAPAAEKRDIRSVLTMEWARQVGHSLTTRHVPADQTYANIITMLAEAAFGGNEDWAKFYFTEAAESCDLDAQGLARAIRDHYFEQVRARTQPSADPENQLNFDDFLGLPGSLRTGEHLILKGVGRDKAAGAAIHFTANFEHKPIDEVRKNLTAVAKAFDMSTEELAWKMREHVAELADGDSVLSDEEPEETISTNEEGNETDLDAENDRVQQNIRNFILNQARTDAPYKEIKAPIRVLLHRNADMDVDDNQVLEWIFQIADERGATIDEGMNAPEAYGALRKWASRKSRTEHGPRGRKRPAEEGQEEGMPAQSGKRHLTANVRDADITSDPAVDEWIRTKESTINLQGAQNILNDVHSGKTLLSACAEAVPSLHEAAERYKVTTQFSNILRVAELVDALQMRDYSIGQRYLILKHVVAARNQLKGPIYAVDFPDWQTRAYTKIDFYQFYAYMNTLSPQVQRVTWAVLSDISFGMSSLSECPNFYRSEAVVVNAMRNVSRPLWMHRVESPEERIKIVHFCIARNSIRVPADVRNGQNKRMNIRQKLWYAKQRNLPVRKENED
ncbi:hypothetical protein [Amycolatopsis sp. cmx-4-61]|uniref:hypothetical protein n=1 Tax=Amycolatopsis sp. cmx-4-61 TaxID=2790937 RepID=UPI00397D7F1D